jgi:hypothetical protein
MVAVRTAKEAKMVKVAWTAAQVVEAMVEEAGAGAMAGVAVEATTLSVTEVKVKVEVKVGW